MEFETDRARRYYRESAPLLELIRAGEPPFAVGADCDLFAPAGSPRRIAIRCADPPDLAVKPGEDLDRPARGAAVDLTFRYRSTNSSTLNSSARRLADELCPERGHKRRADCSSASCASAESRSRRSRGNHRVSRRLGRGVNRITAESTFGGGRNAPGGTVNKYSACARNWHSTEKYPYSRVPGFAVIRSATSFWIRKTA